LRLAQGVIGIAGYLLGGLAAFSLLLGAWLASNTLSLSEDAERSQGTVIGYRESNASGGGRVFTPRIQFETQSGTRVQFMGQVTAPIKRFAEGAAVPVIYRRSAPDVARIDAFVDNWLAPSVALGLGTLSTLAALMLVRSSRRALA
jgi:hypothetical protein